MSAHYWDPIGYSASYYFAGKYNGGGFIISGMYTNPTDSYQGLFGYVYGVTGSTCKISNIVIIDAYIQAYTYAGGIIGYARHNITVEYCGFNGNIINYSSSSSTLYLGGIIGYYYCNWSSYPTSVDGILSIQYCYNTADIYSTKQAYVGGILGRQERAAILNRFLDCYNTGDLTVTYSTSSAYTMGGIAGYLYYDYYQYGSGFITGIGIARLYNTGNISNSTRGYTGGLFGTVSSSYGSITIKEIEDSWNFGAVSGYTGRTYAIAYITTSAIDFRVSSCYWGGNCTLTSAANTSSEITVSNCSTTADKNPKTLEWYENNLPSWNFNTVWGFVEGFNDGYPMLMDTQFSKITYYSNDDADDDIFYYKTENSIVIAGDIFTREGYIIENWNTEADGTGDVYEKGDVYTGNGDLELYAQWILPIYEITLDSGGIVGGTPNTIYQWYGNAYYCEESCINEISSLTFPTNNGFTFRGFYTGLNGTGMQVVNSSGQFLTYTTEYHSWHAYFVANNPAYYDSGGGYWYVENGMIPQSKVTGSLKTTLNSQWNSLSNGSTYVMGVQSFTSKVYNGNEYCLYNNEYYLVEPIRWRLQANSSQKTGYGTTTDTLAVMDTIVYLGRYFTTEINAGSGYSSTAVDYLYNTLNSENNGMDSTYLVNWTQSMPTFGTTSLNGTAQNVTARVFVSSIDEINTVAGSGKVKFSDLVKDYLKSTGNGMLYYTRDLGTNYNNIICLNENGDRTQRKPNLTANRLGVQFTIKVTEYACVEG